ncbi:DNA-binding protein [Brevibacillus dissolubilis]|uniref:DNA-binding protein n=1 Tax=Brevibacillus dissolubilis TaxID=1844116 RepID=UPI003F658862
MKLTSTLWKGLLSLSLVLPFSTAYVTSTDTALAVGPLDPAPVIQPKVVNANNAKKILFDNTHAQTAGAADWVIDGAFSDFGNALANEGFYVTELRKTTAITYDDLKNYSVFVVGEANIPYKTTEQAAMVQYVQNGGSIFFISDHYNADRNKNRYDASEVFNGYRRGAWADPAKGMSTEERNSYYMQDVVSSDWLGTNFGVRFRYNAIGDVTANNIVAPSQTFGITSGVSTVAMHAGSTLAIRDPKKAKGIVYLPTTTAKWASAVDQGVYNGGGVAEGPYAAISKVGAGKAAFIGDSSPVEDATPKYLREETGSTKKTYDGFKEQNDGVLLVNMVKWLATPESYTGFDQVAGLTLDQPTALLSMETPETSTEPQAEPWSAPATGYKWFDPMTYKAGSYGAGTPVGDGTVTPPPGGGTGGYTCGTGIYYCFQHQATLPNGVEFPVRVVLDNQTPNTTISNLNLGVYNSSGTQIAMVQNANGTWPTAYGYSSYFSITTDANGHGYKDMKMIIKSGTIGAANMRLRQSTTTKVTEAVTIGNVAVEPLP